MTTEDGSLPEGLTYESIKKLCFRLGMATHTSVEFYYGLPYSDLLDFVDELYEQGKRSEQK